MPRQVSQSKAKPSHADRVRRFLTGGGVAREDSDDELGLEDHPWKWIYATSSQSRNSSSVDEADGNREEKIVGARMGEFECRIGDCVLLKAEGTSNEAWIGIICEFQDDEEKGEKAANFMWFSTEREIRNKQKKRTDAMQNEVYITPSWDINPLVSINGKASIVSSSTFSKRFPSGKVPRTSKDCGKIFICRRGCNTRTATYTNEFDWEKIYRGAEDLDALVERVKTQTRSTRKRKRDVADGDAEPGDPDAELDIPKTPAKRRKPQQAQTPTSKSVLRTPQKFTTPTHKRIIVKRPLEFTPLGTRILSPQNTTSSPFQLARTTLHVSSVPLSLPCRNTEFTSVYAHLEAAISAGSGACIYISGTPGTGKTATVREVVAQLQASVQAEELDDFIFVEINGMKVTDPHQAYSLLWEALRGERVSPAQALGLLEREFDHPNPRRVPCVMLMDELDQLVTKTQSVMYNFFNWPGLRHSRLIVLAVANTMDLPERTLSNKISSRLGLTRITFPGYTHDQLMQIIQSRLSSVPATLVDPDAIQFASRKVAAVSGDARRALDICRRAVEIAESEAQSEQQEQQNPLLNTPSKKRSKNLRSEAPAPAPASPPDQANLIDNKTTTLPQNPKQQPPSAPPARGKVTIATIRRAIAEATSSPLQQHLKSLPLASKLFLAALLARVRRSGIAESGLGDVLDEALRLARSASNENPRVAKFLLSSAPWESLNTMGSSSTAAPPATITTAGPAIGAPSREKETEREEEEEEGGEEGERGDNEPPEIFSLPRPGNNPVSVSVSAPVPRVLGMNQAAIELAAAGVVIVEATGRRGGERGAKIRLAVGEEEVRGAFGGDEEVRGLGWGG